MARTVTLAQLRTDARLYADQRVHTPGASTFVTDTELTRLLNLQLAELHELFIAARGDDYVGTVAEDTIAIGGGVARYSLPVDFFQLLSATLRWGATDHEELRALSSHPEADQYRVVGWGSHTPKGYRLRGGQIEIYPAPTSSVDLVLQYAPVFTDLAADGDTYDGVNGWEKLVALGAAIEMRTIEGRDLGRLPALFDAQRERIETMVEERQAADPFQIRDVGREHRRDRWPFWHV